MRIYRDPSRHISTSYLGGYKLFQGQDKSWYPDEMVLVTFRAKVSGAMILVTCLLISPSSSDTIWQLWLPIFFSKELSSTLNMCWAKMICTPDFWALIISVFVLPWGICFSNVCLTASVKRQHYQQAVLISFVSFLLPCIESKIQIVWEVDTCWLCFFSMDTFLEFSV